MESLLCLFQIVIIVLVLLHHQTCDAITNTKNQTYCPPSSCGKIRNIKHPFRLKDDPATCGDPRYEFSCENNITTLSLFSGKYYVKSIDYKSYSIRIVDPGIKEGDCSTIPRYFLTKSNFTSPYNYNYSGDLFAPWVGYVIYLKCSKPVKNDSMYVHTSPCIKWHSKGHVYAIAGDIKTGNLNVDCRVMLVATSSASSLSNNYLSNTPQHFSYSEIHGMLSYGFELSWLRRACEDFCDLSQQDCYINTTGYLACKSDYCTTPLGIDIRCSDPE